MTNKEIQRNLNTLAFNCGSVDGIIGEKTKDAIKRYQRARGLVVDGIAGVNTKGMLESDIKNIQINLNTLGFHCGSVDGIIGEKTTAAIKAYQKDRGLVVDGIVGVNTSSSLEKDLSQKGDEKIDWTKEKYFKKSEFKCNCKEKYCSGYPTEVDPTLLDMLNSIREKFGLVIITGGLRCIGYNNTLSGSIKTSKHLSGKAADIYVKGASKEEVIALAKKHKDYSYAYTNNTYMGSAVHVDVR